MFVLFLFDMIPFDRPDERPFARASGGVCPKEVIYRPIHNDVVLKNASITVSFCLNIFIIKYAYEDDHQSSELQ